MIYNVLQVCRILCLEYYVYVLFATSIYLTMYAKDLSILTNYLSIYLSPYTLCWNNVPTISCMGKYLSIYLSMYIY